MKLLPYLGYAGLGYALAPGPSWAWMLGIGCIVLIAFTSEGLAQRRERAARQQGVEVFADELRRSGLRLVRR